MGEESKDNFEVGETKELLKPVPVGLPSSYWCHCWRQFMDSRCSAGARL